MEHPPLNTTRFPSLDYLRGLMAFAVLVFHYDKWLTGTWDASTLQGKLGVYAVSVFFVLSGLTLTLVYESRLDHSLGTWARFYRKRIFRIFPLLWLATICTLLIDDVSRTGRVIFLNLTGLFGFIDPAEDIATGAWSIGCELVFYAVFPTLLLLCKRNRMVFLGIFVALFAWSIWVAFHWFSPAQSKQVEWWETYVQAGNHAFFFAGGVAIAVFRHECLGIRGLYWRWILVVTIGWFVGWPIGSEAFYLVSGWNRVALSALTLIAVAAYFNSNIQLAELPHRILAWLGAVSYSLYLWHPLVFRATQVMRTKFYAIIPGDLGRALDYWFVFLIALIGSLVWSHFSYFFLEKPLAQRG